MKENIISIPITLNKCTNTYFKLQFKLAIDMQTKLNISMKNVFKDQQNENISSKNNEIA